MQSLVMDTSVALGLKSRCQMARRITEAWGYSSLYCAACTSDRLSSTPHNTAAVDFRCPQCGAAYQLKASTLWGTPRIPDGAYGAMVNALRGDAVPNLLVMQYDRSWTVRNLLLVPSFFFTLAAVEPRKPLSAGARRAGWIGCNIRIDSIADLGKLLLVESGHAAIPSLIRSQYAKLRPLGQIDVRGRGWTIDTLRLLRRFADQRFTIDEAYKLETELAVLYPGNQNIRPQIRKQLQILRDKRLIRFVTRGVYEFT